MLNKPAQFTINLYQIYKTDTSKTDIDKTLICSKI